MEKKVFLVEFASTAYILALLWLCAVLCGAMLCTETQNDFDFCLFPLSVPLTILFPSRSLFLCYFSVLCYSIFTLLLIHIVQRETRAKFLVFHFSVLHSQHFVISEI